LRLAGRQRGDETHLSRLGHHRRADRAQHARHRKSGRQATFSSDILYDTLAKYDPDHLLMRITRKRRCAG
jgi:hypothetical protein